MLDEEEELSLAYEPPLSPLDISVLWNRLIRLEFSDKASLLAFEQDLYRAFKLFPNNGAYSILMLQIQLMLGNLERARSLAYRIWEQGGDIPSQIKLLFLQNLLSLNLPEMAQELAYSFLQDIDNLPIELYLPLLNFGFAFQDKDVLEILAARIEDKEEGPLWTIIDFCAQHNYWPVLKAFHKVIFQTLSLCLADYRVFFDTVEEKTRLNFRFSVLKGADDFEAKIHRLIMDFSQEHHLPIYDSIAFSLEDITHHPRLDTAFLPAL